MTLTLGLDVGTQGTKGLVVDADAGRVVARASVGYGLIEGLPPGHAEQHPHLWRDAVRVVVAELLADPAVDVERLAAVGETVASLSHSIKNILQGLRGGADVLEVGLRREDLKIARSLPLGRDPTVCLADVARRRAFDNDFVRLNS